MEGKEGRRGSIYAFGGGEGGRSTYYCHFLSNDFDIWSSKVFERDNPREARAVDHVPGVGQDVDRESDVPHLRGG